MPTYQTPLYAAQIKLGHSGEDTKLDAPAKGEANPVGRVGSKVFALNAACPDERLSGNDNVFLGKLPQDYLGFVGAFMWQHNGSSQGLLRIGESGSDLCVNQVFPTAGSDRIVAPQNFGAMPGREINFRAGGGANPGGPRVHMLFCSPSGDTD